MPVHPDPPDWCEWMNDTWLKQKDLEMWLNRETYWRCAQTRQIWYQQGQTPLDTSADNKRWTTVAQGNVVYKRQMWLHTQEFVCVRGSVFSISAQRPVLWRQTLPPQPLNKPAQQKQELVFRTGPKLSCGQIAYLIKVVMEISKKTLWPHSYELHFCSCIVPSDVSFLLAIHGFSSFPWLYCRFD